MLNIYIDIETIPAGEPVDPASLTPPATMSKADTIERWYAEKAPAVAEEAYRKRALDSMRGEILCIGYAVEDGPVQSLMRDGGMSEKELIQSFDYLIAKAFALYPRDRPTWIGHNAKEFDMLWLWRRAIRYGCAGLKNLIQLDRYKGNVEDTMVLWAATDRKGYTTLSALSEYLGLGGKTDGIDGSKVYDFYLQGRLGEIAAYCRDDVALVRSIYKVLTGLATI
jgi:hypothetical protein